MQTISREKAERLMRLATGAAMASALLLIGIKGAVYFESKSVAILSSLADSAVDFLASCVTFLAVRYALSPADAEHRFGHGKAEPLSGLAQAAFVAGSAVLVMVEAVSRLRHPEPLTNSTEGIIVMVVAMTVTLALVLFQRHVVKRTGSLAIGADSLHYGGDLLMNATVIVALVLSGQFGLLWIDPLFGFCIGAFLLVNAVVIARKAVGSLMDHELPEDRRAAITAIAQKNPLVREVHDLRTRTSGLQTFIQMHLVLDGALTLAQAHRISADVHKDIETAFPGADIIIHQDPADGA